MRRIMCTVFASILGIALAGASSFIASEAEALVFCAKAKNPAKIKVRGDACKVPKETEVSVLDIPEVQAEFDYVPGRDVEESLPMITFNEEEWTGVGEQ